MTERAGTGQQPHRRRPVPTGAALGVIVAIAVGIILLVVLTPDSAPEPAADKCGDVRSATQKFFDKAQSYPSGTVERQQQVRFAMTTVTQNPDCYTVEDRAKAADYLTQTRR